MDYKKIMLDNMKKRNLRKYELPEKDDLLFYLNNMMLITGRIDIMYCNSFLSEAEQLLINSIFLYEDGYFDCAFYSIRQAGEVYNSMLYLANLEEEGLEQWNRKERFPMDSQIRNKLQKMALGYDEIKNELEEYFEHHKQLVNRAHKIIHKQGFDTFYSRRFQKNCQQENEIKLFLDC